MEDQPCAGLAGGNVSFHARGALASDRHWVTDSQLIAELRSRGYVVSARSIEDVKPIMAADGELPERIASLTDGELDDFADEVLFHPENMLKAALAETGHATLSNFWKMFWDEIVDEWKARQEAEAAPRA